MDDDPTVTDVKAMASEVRYVSARLGNMAEAAPSTEWGENAANVLCAARDVLHDLAQRLEPGVEYAVLQ